ncbi:MAG TPA: DUF3459 domain-containing protein, partial [Acidimicrobiales bacterium]|nr:DUF3459 domain-containing protein [Acidimicrobiales bacterium]
RRDPESVLHFVRHLLAVRRASPDLHAGSYRALDAPPGVWAWRRGASTAVAVNLSAEPARLGLDGAGGTVAAATTARRTGQAAGAELVLGPWEGVVVTGA